MTPRRRETKIPTHQPVRFYKIVALSFLCITLVLLGLIVFMSSKRATITITTKESPVDITLSVAAADLGGSYTTSTLELSQKFFPKGDTEVPGEATGIMTVINDSDIPQPLIATTRFVSSDGVLFRLREGITVPANGTIDAEVYADQEGGSGNIGPDSFTIPGLNESRQQEVYGKTTKAMEGGLRSVGVLSKGDIETAEKELIEKAKEEAARTYTELAQSGQEVIHAVIDYTSTPSAEIGTELSEFDLSMVISVAHISYDVAEANKAAREALLRRIVDDSETIEPSTDDARVTFESYQDGSAMLSLFYDGTAQINPESGQLDKVMFYGKSRDEARRYVLALDHVQSVDIDFSPAWMQTIPHVHDHVNVIIKHVR